MNKDKIRTIVLGIFRQEGRLLVFEGSDPARDLVFYRPLGGGIEFGEYGHQALAREMREEIGAEVTDVRYLGLIENIFDFRGKQGHEIALLYEGRFTDPSFYGQEAFASAQDNGVAIKVLWKPLADFENGDLLVPGQLLRLLMGMPVAREEAHPKAAYTR